MKEPRQYPPAPANAARRESGTTSVRVSRLTLELLEEELRELPRLSGYRVYSRRSLDELLYQLGTTMRGARAKRP